MENRTWVAKTFFGFEDLTAAELRALGAQNVQIGPRAVQFVGDKGFMYKANLALRTALRILKPIHHYTASHDKALYQGAGQFDWHTLIRPDHKFWIDVTLHSPHFTHSQFVAQRIKDAIVDQLRARTGQRPSVDKDQPDWRIDVRIDRDQVYISLDSSGASLHHRGYRTQTNAAPLNEVLAAGILLRSGWEGRTDFLDPMCGSGTLLIEAAMIACNIPANIHRKVFAFEKWNDWDPELFSTIVDSLMHRAREYQGDIWGFDQSAAAVEVARQNVLNAGLEGYIHIERGNFFTTARPGKGSLHLAFNPPYGERLDIDPPSFYKQIGDTLKQHYSGCHAWMICAPPEWAKYVGLRPSGQHKVFNGGLEAKLLHYALYEGSKKAKFQPGSSDGMAS